MAGERRFSSHEAAHVLRRATDGEHVAGPGGGLTLDELVAAARDAGIDPAAVRLAAAITPARANPVQSLLVGAPVNPVVRARFQGEFAPAQAESLAALLEDRLELTGRVDVEGGRVVWSEEHGFGRTEVSVRSAEGAVDVTATAERKGHLIGLVLGILTSLALLLVPLGGFAGVTELLGSLAALVGPLATTALGTRLLWPLLQRPTLRRLEAAVLAVGVMVTETATPALPPPAPPPARLQP
jgi:hypothetical protein